MARLLDDWRSRRILNVTYCDCWASRPTPCEPSNEGAECEYLLLGYQQHHRQGGNLDLTLPQQFVRLSLRRRIADRLIWTGLGRLPDVTEEVPTIAVDFVSTAKRDHGEKKSEYGKSGIKEYWIIDRFQRTLTVVQYRGRSVKEHVVAEGKLYESPLLPGFQLPLARLLEAADRLAQAKLRKRTPRRRN